MSDGKLEVFTDGYSIVVQTQSDDTSSIHRQLLSFAEARKLRDKLSKILVGHDIADPEPPEET